MWNYWWTRLFTPDLPIENRGKRTQTTRKRQPNDLVLKFWDVKPPIQRLIISDRVFIYTVNSICRLFPASSEVGSAILVRTQSAWSLPCFHRVIVHAHSAWHNRLPIFSILVKTFTFHVVHVSRKRQRTKLYYGAATAATKKPAYSFFFFSVQSIWMCLEKNAFF